jgi:hypothetical protein
MTREQWKQLHEALTKAIELAVAGGWQLPEEFSGWTIAEISQWTLEMGKWQGYVYNHQFCKALWPWDDTVKCPYCGISLTGSLMHPRPCPFGVAQVFAQPMWQFHLQQMVIADNPLKYLEEHI